MICSIERESGLIDLDHRYRMPCTSKIPARCILMQEISLFRDHFYEEIEYLNAQVMVLCPVKCDCSPGCIPWLAIGIQVCTKLFYIRITGCYHRACYIHMGNNSKQTAIEHIQNSFWLFSGLLIFRKN